MRIAGAEVADGAVEDQIADAQGIEVGCGSARNVVVTRHRVDRSGGKGLGERDIAGTADVAGESARPAVELQRRAGCDRIIAGVGAARIEAQRAAVEVDDAARLVVESRQDSAGGERSAVEVFVELAGIVEAADADDVVVVDRGIEIEHAAALVVEAGGAAGERVVDLEGRECACVGRKRDGAEVVPGTAVAQCRLLVEVGREGGGSQCGEDAAAADDAVGEGERARHVDVGCALQRAAGEVQHGRCANVRCLCQIEHTT